MMTPIEEARLRIRQIVEARQENREAAARGLELAAAILEGQQMSGTAAYMKAEASRIRNGH